MNRLKNVNIKAVLLGSLVDIGGTLVSGIIYLLALYIAILIRQAGMEGAEELSIEQITNGTGFQLAALIIGLGYTLLGGFVAASVAKGEKMLQAGVMGGISLLLSLFFLDADHIWYDIISLLLTLPVALLGGYLATEEPAGKLG